MKYINYISDTLYCITDVCNIFNIKEPKIIKILKNNNINYLYDSNSNLYIDSKNIYKLFTLINVKEHLSGHAFYEFINSIKRNAFGEDQYDRINKRIILNM